MGKARSAFWLVALSGSDGTHGGREPLRRAVGSLCDQTVPTNGRIEKIDGTGTLTFGRLAVSRS